MSGSDFKVIIVGASIAGLTLANLLQKLEIDYVVLEAYGTVAPQLGASIGLNPNGLRILDQLGCYEDILEFSAAAETTTVRDETGRVLHSHYTSRHVKERHGYPVLFLERRSTIQVLYNHIRDKSRILVNERVTRVELIEDGVCVHTTSGESFGGSIVVGADGIHSSIRKEMWRLADEIEPGSIPSSVKDAIPLEWGCIFAMSKPTGDIKATQVHLTHKKGGTLAIMCGKGDRPFWFYFFKLDKPHRGFPVPRFTKEDEIKIVEAEGNLPATAQVRMKDLYANVEFSTTTALPHHVFPQFYFDRIFLVGDSVHKFNPLSGQGGNSAIETAAALADSLYELLKKRTGGKAGSSRIREAFAKTQNMRQARAQALVDASIVLQRLSAWDSGALKFIDTWVAPLLSTDVITDEASKPLVGARKVHSIPIPSVPHTIPYEDELHRAPTPRKVSGMVRVGFYLGILGVMVNLVVQVALKESDTILDRLHEAIKAGPPDAYSMEYRTPMNLDHVPLVGKNLSGLIAHYFPATEMWDMNFRLLTFYLSISEFVVFAIWMLEASRVRSKLSPARWALPYGIISHFSAIGLGAPLYFLLETLATGKPCNFWPTATHVEPAEARAVLPTLVIGMLLPTLFAFAPFLDSVVRQCVLLWWWFFPVVLSVLSRFLTARFRACDGASSGEDTPTHTRSAVSLRYVRQLFGFSFLISLLSHLLTIGVSLMSSSSPSEVSLSSVFLFRHNDKLSPFEENHNAFLFDYYTMTASTLIWSIGCVRDLERNGLVPAVSWAAVLLAGAVGTIVCGPAAVVSAICFWREAKLAQKPKVKGA